MLELVSELFSLLIKALSLCCKSINLGFVHDAWYD